MRPTPPPRTTRADVGDRGDRHDVQRDPPRLLGDDGAPDRVPGARRGEDRARVVGRGEGRGGRRGPGAGVAAAAGREPGRKRRERGGARVEVLVVGLAHEVELPGGAMAAAAQLAAEHEPRAETGPDGDEREVVDAPAEAARVLAERREVDVVLDRHRQPEAPLELRADGHALEAVGVLGEPHPAGPLLDDAGDPGHDGVDAVGRQAADGDEPVAHPGDGIEQLDRDRRDRAPRPAARGSCRGGPTAHRAGTARRCRCRARARPPGRARRTRLRSCGRPAPPRPRGRARRAAATGARPTPSASRSARGARSRRGRSGPRRGSRRGPRAR